MPSGQPRREEDEDEREGVWSGFVASHPVAGKRVVQLRARRRALEWAQFVRALLAEQDKQADKLVLRMAHLNPPPIASWYEAFEPQKAWERAHTREIHYPRVHGSWLNVAARDLAVLAGQALCERMASAEQGQARATAWQQERHQKRRGIQWQFTTKKARIQLKQLYPKVTNDA